MAGECTRRTTLVEMNFPSGRVNACIFVVFGRLIFYPTYRSRPFMDS